MRDIKFVPDFGKSGTGEFLITKEVYLKTAMVHGKETEKLGEVSSRDGRFRFQNFIHASRWFKTQKEAIDYGFKYLEK